MQSVTRRQFVLGSAAALAGAAIELKANPLGMPIGCQTYMFRETIG